MINKNFINIIFKIQEKSNKMSSCSSDSEDDLYTNTASIFKNITKKLTEVNTDFLDSTTEEINLTDCLTEKQKSDVISDIEISDTEKSDVEILSKKNKKGTVVKFSQNTPVNLDESIDVIEQINACLERNQKGRGRRKSRGTPRVTRSTRKSKRQMKKRKVDTPQVIASIEIDVDYPILNSNQFTRPQDLGEEITVKVLWKSQCLKKFDMHKKQKLETIFKHYAEQENVSEELLYFSVNDTIVCKIDTPESLNLNAASIIDGGILSSKTHLSSGYKQNTIELKIQWKNLKKPFIYIMNVTDNMSVMMDKCSEEMNVSVENLKFYFDGEVINPADTPRSLELEGGECIDCIQK